ncbi:MAG: hypothetical protein FWF53_10765 [Candidatus Azobacteroides sp.]|nr:hypothetical protein [Candidatus Azobacteroides sp.]
MREKKLKQSITIIALFLLLSGYYSFPRLTAGNPAENSVPESLEKYDNLRSIQRQSASFGYFDEAYPVEYRISKKQIITKTQNDNPNQEQLRQFNRYFAFDSINLALFYACEEPVRR